MKWTRKFMFQTTNQSIIVDFYLYLLIVDRRHLVIRVCQGVKSRGLLQHLCHLYISYRTLWLCLNIAIENGDLLRGFIYPFKKWWIFPQYFANVYQRVALSSAPLGIASFDKQLGQQLWFANSRRYIFSSSFCRLCTSTTNTKIGFQGRNIYSRFDKWIQSQKIV